MELLKYSFIQNALVASFFASLACGIIGTYVVVKRLVFLSGGLAHASFGGLGLAHFAKIYPLFGALLFSLLAALGLGFFKGKTEHEDTAMGILWPLGMSLGVIFIYLSKSYTGDLFVYLFGNILMVSLEDLVVMAVLVAVILLLVVVLFYYFQAVCFDEEFAQVRGIGTHRLYVLLLVMIAFSVILLMKVVGIVLLIALLTIPAAMSKKCVSSIRGMMILASFLSFVFMVAGIFLSYVLDLPTGALIILLACGAYVVLELVLQGRRYALR